MNLSAFASIKHAMTYRGHVDLLQSQIVVIDLVGLQIWLNDVNAGYRFEDSVLCDSLLSRGYVGLNEFPK